MSPAIQQAGTIWAQLLALLGFQVAGVGQQAITMLHASVSCPIWGGCHALGLAREPPMQRQTSMGQMRTLHAAQQVPVLQRKLASMAS